VARLSLLAVALFAWPAALQASAVGRWAPEIREASARFAVPAGWIERVMQVESGGRTRLGGQPIVSSAGAMGLMQVMPATWAEMRRVHGLGLDPHNPRDNILAGTAYLKLMYERFGFPGLFAAYNAGPGRYAEHLRTGRSLPAETRAYVAKVGGAAARPSAAPPGTSVLPRSRSPLFARAAGAAPHPRPGPNPGASPLFAIRY